MSRLIAGILIGVVITTAVFYLVDRSPPAVQDISIGESESRENNAAVVRANSARHIDEVAKEDAEKLAKSLPSVADSNTESFEIQVEPTVAQTPDTSGQESSQASSAITASQDYPPEIADMIENSVDKELQARYESDEREESWATYMEGQLAAYFAQKPELSQFNISMIDCRTSICEIHALGYGPDALTRWNTGTADIVTQTWHDFQSMSIDHQNPQPDILGIVLILSKKTD